MGGFIKQSALQSEYNLVLLYVFVLFSLKCELVAKGPKNMICGNTDIDEINTSNKCWHSYATIIYISPVWNQYKTRISFLYRDISF